MPSEIISQLLSLDFGALLNVKDLQLTSLIIFSLIAFAVMAISADFTCKNAKKVGSSFGGGIRIAMIAAATSFPEFIISIVGAIENQADIVVGNVLGSNIVNITLVLGILAIIKPIQSDKGLRELFLNQIVAFLGIFFIFITINLTLFPLTLNVIRSNYYVITFYEGIILIISYIIHILVLNILHRSHENVGNNKHNIFLVSLFTFIGAFVIYLAAKAVITLLVRIAEIYSIPTSIIGVTIIALGTSLPELTVSIIPLLKGKGDHSFENLVGSSAFNVGMGIGIPALIMTLSISDMFASLHAPMAIITAIVVGFMIAKNSISRRDGLILVSIYIIYTILTIFGVKLIPF